MKRERKTKAERAVERTFNSFIEYQKEAEERFETREQKRWERERELEEKKQEEERKHQKEMIEMLGKIFNPGPMPSYHQPPYNTYNYNDYS